MKITVRVTEVPLQMNLGIWAKYVADKVIPTPVEIGNL